LGKRPDLVGDLGGGLEELEGADVGVDVGRLLGGASKPFERL
jgi:hypothetical protein